MHVTVLQDTISNPIINSSAKCQTVLSEISSSLCAKKTSASSVARIFLNGSREIVEWKMHLKRSEDYSKIQTGHHDKLLLDAFISLSPPFPSCPFCFLALRHQGGNYSYDERPFCQVVDMSDRICVFTTIFSQICYFA